jgi:hypothetical protein
MPFAASSGVTYDSGDFLGVFNKALEISDHAGFAKRKKESRKRGKLRGIAVGSYLEVTAPPGVELGKIVFEDDGSVKLITGTLDYGQGHATPFAAYPLRASSSNKATATSCIPATAPAARARSPPAAWRSSKPQSWSSRRARRRRRI